MEIENQQPRWRERNDDGRSKKDWRKESALLYYLILIKTTGKKEQPPPWRNFQRISKRKLKTSPNQNAALHGLLSRATVCFVATKWMDGLFHAFMIPIRRNYTWHVLDNLGFGLNFHLSRNNGPISCFSLIVNYLLQNIIINTSKINLYNINKFTSNFCFYI